MFTLLRVVGGIATGLAVAFVLVVAVEFFSAIVHPLPADFDGTHEAMCAHVANYPDWVLAVVVPMWGLTAFLGVWIAGRLGNRVSAFVVATLLLAGVILNLAMLPYPLWFKLVQLAAVLIAVALAYHWSRRRRLVPSPSAKPVGV